MDRHPVVAAVDTLAELLRGLADVPVEFLPTSEKRDALLAVGRVAAQVEGLRLRLMAAAADVADDEAFRDIASWLASEARTDPRGNRRAQRLATSLATKWSRLARALAEGAVNAEQAAVIATALDRLPDDVPPEILMRAERHLLADAESFGPRELTVLGRRILDVVAPELGEEAERLALEDEEDAPVVRRPWSPAATATARRRSGSRCPTPPPTGC